MERKGNIIMMMIAVVVILLRNQMRLATEQNFVHYCPFPDFPIPDGPSLRFESFASVGQLDAVTMRQLKVAASLIND